MKDNKIAKNYHLKIGDKLMDFSIPKVMGIINLTPDSFYDGGKYQAKQNLIKKIKQLQSEDVDIIDVGGVSTRPMAKEVDEEVELQRVIPAIRLIKKHFVDAIISIDTYRANVAEKAIKEGAHIINDISGGRFDNNMFKTVAELDVPYVLMHSRGTPQTMQSLVNYSNVTTDVIKELSFSINKLRELGVKDILIDPGFGFAKTMEQNYELFKNLEHLHVLDCPLVVGVSRKSMIYKLLNTNPKKALNGTAVLNTVALIKGAKVLRVHDIKEAKEVVKLTQALISS